MNRLSEISAQEKMIRRQIIDRGIDDPRVIEAMRAIPRDKFFIAELRDSAFEDRAAPIGHDQTISQPYMVALMSSRLKLDPTHKVLEIGTGSGYHTAILAKLAGEVYTVERVKPLLDEAWEKLLSLDLRNVHFRFGDGTIGWPEAAPFDRVLIAAAAPTIPQELLLSQLKDGGIAVLPVGGTDQQMLLEIHRHGDRLDAIDICACRFVKLVGKHGWSDEAE